MEIRNIYEQIMTLRSFSPSHHKVSDLFSRLVEYATNPMFHHDLTVSEVSNLQIASASAEVQLEKYWAKKIVAASNPLAEVEKFPYINNYRLLTRMELDTLESTGSKLADPLFFVGGGLPLSAYILAKDYGLRSVVLDNDPTMAELASAFVRKIRMEKMIEIVQASGESFNGYGELVVVAALAGVDDTVKRQIFEKIPKTATILARSVEVGSNRELLYRPLPVSVLDSRRLVSLTHPGRTQRYQEVINSAAILGGLEDAA